MKVRLAAGVTKDFYEASTPKERLGAALLCPIYFLCCLLTRVPREREIHARVAVAGRGSLFRQGECVDGV